MDMHTFTRTIKRQNGSKGRDDILLLLGVQYRKMCRKCELSPKLKLHFGAETREKEEEGYTLLVYCTGILY